MVGNGNHDEKGRAAPALIHPRPDQPEPRAPRLTARLSEKLFSLCLLYETLPKWCL